MPALALITLVFQALLLAHGGLTTLGANLFSLGVVGPWAMWFLLRLLLRIGWKRDRCIFLSTVVGDLATYVTTACQLALAYPSAHGGYAASFVKFLGVFLITQIPISIAEGLLTVVLLRNLAADQAVGLQGAAAPHAQERFRSANAVVLIVVFATMIGAFLYANYTKPLGSDDQAVTAIQNLRPGYRPIARPLFIPSEAVEPLLFTLQAAIGVAVLTWAIFWFRARRRLKLNPGAQRHRHMHLHPHLSDIAFTNAWRHRNPWEKVLFGGGLLVVTFFVAPFPWCIAIALLVTLAATAGARIPVSSWLGVLSVPVSFAILTALGILVQIESFQYWSFGGLRLGRPAACERTAAALRRGDFLPRVHRMDHAADGDDPGLPTYGHTGGIDRSGADDLPVPLRHRDHSGRNEARSILAPGPRRLPQPHARAFDAGERAVPAMRTAGQTVGGWH